ncbi:MAG: hypothetical protein F6K14_30510 [Symploca sp. SIO2C1]|nr:hypothetical protein [Symploca sp. SIO2C1]
MRLLFIRQIVQQAFQTGYLTVEAEDQLRLLLQTTKYGQEDINAFIRLQQAAMTGLVQQQSRELKTSQPLPDKQLLGEINKYAEVCN